jgi:hypothetical protein
MSEDCSICRATAGDVKFVIQVEAKGIWHKNMKKNNWNWISGIDVLGTLGVGANFTNIFDLNVNITLANKFILINSHHPESQPLF